MLFCLDTQTHAIYTRQLRALRDKIRDPDLRKQLAGIEQEVQTYKDPKEPRTWQDIIADRKRQVKKYVSEKALENEEMLRAIDDALPFDVINSKFEGDELYLTFPILGDVQVRALVPCVCVCVCVYACVCTRIHEHMCMLRYT